MHAIGSDEWTGKEAEEKYKVPRNSFGIWLVYLGCPLTTGEPSFEQRTAGLRQEMFNWQEDEISRIPYHRPGLLNLLRETTEMTETTETMAAAAAAAAEAAEDPHAEERIAMTSEEDVNCPIKETMKIRLCLPMVASSWDQPLADGDTAVGSLTPDQSNSMRIQPALPTRRTDSESPKLCPNTNSIPITSVGLDLENGSISWSAGCFTKAAR